MFDPDTLIISYDKARGEPRGARARHVDPAVAGLGSCIDCTLCVQVCPTGIDIRHGLQYACIACAACVDVCDSVMDKMGYAKGLIRYTTENELNGKIHKLWRPRVLIYGAVLMALTLSLVAAVLLRVPLRLEVLHDRNQLYRETADGFIENVYTVKIINMDQRPHRYTLGVDGIDGARLAIDRAEIVVEPGQQLDFPVRVQASAATVPRRRTSLSLHVQAQDESRQRADEQAVFLAP